MTTHRNWKLVGELFAITGLAGVTALRAVTVESIDVHGAVSVTAAYSDKYNYLGNTRKDADFNLVESIVNGSHRFENGLRASAQLYAYKLGGFRDLALDFAHVDYSFNEHLGVRVGRNKHAFGLYGDTQDIDILRPFAFLPLDYYDKSLRPLNAAIDGLNVYGQVPLAKAGSIDYQFDAGWVPTMDTSSPFFQGINGATPFSYSSVTKHVAAYNAWIFWNTPIEGLRVGASIILLPNFEFNGSMKSSADLALATSDARVLPFLFPAGFWDAFVAGQPASARLDYTGTYYSAEYTRGDWQFAAEAQYTDVKETDQMPVLGASTMTRISASYYAMATWQATHRLQLGTYYGIAYGDRNDPNGHNVVAVPAHTMWLKDFALAASYKLTDWWLVKAETHFLDGTKGMSAGNGDAATWSPHWTYVALKSTFSF
jgi:hypothetical protein